jgi:hypothetical protein
VVLVLFNLRPDSIVELALGRHGEIVIQLERSHLMLTLEELRLLLVELGLQIHLRSQTHIVLVVKIICLINKYS